MRLSVLAAFDGFSGPLEGHRVPWPYLDSRDDGDPSTTRDALVTTGTGNLIDPVSYATSLPWRIVNTRAKRAAVATDPLATRAEVVHFWHAVKAAQHRKRQGGGNHYDLSPLRLMDEDIEALVQRKLREVDRQLSTIFAGWETWPGDAQLALTSWAWAVGAAAKYPKMISLLRNRDFLGASKEIAVYELAIEVTYDTYGAKVTHKIKREPGTLAERNERNAHLLRNAADVEKHRHDPEPVYWPSLPCGTPDEPGPVA